MLRLQDLTERGPLQTPSRDFYFPKTIDKWHFSEEFCMQKLWHGEVNQTNWPIYSITADVIFYFCDKIFTAQCQATSEVLQFLKSMDGSFPNTEISYRIMLTVPVMMVTGN
jgi:hypothetical protein